MVQRMPPEMVEASASNGETLATVANVLAYVESSVPVILLPTGSDATDVPVDTPVGTIVLMKGA